jgi:glycosyltransferase involved in cell wall biosynthesis
VSTFVVNRSSLLAVVLMVKNEELTIAATLAPLLEQGIRHFFIFDTGSTDNTLSVSEQLLRQAQAIFHLAQEPFIDFATSRNRALTLAEEVFADIPFMIMPDAEWCLSNVSALLRFCERQLPLNTNLFFLRIVMNDVLEFYTARLFRTSAKIRFEGSVHEVPAAKVDEKVPDDIYFDYKQIPLSAEKSVARWQRDLVLLLKEYGEQHEPQPRTLFYLAQTFECLENLHEAYHYYQLRSTIMGWDEENFITLFRLGQIVEKLSQTDSKFTWQQAEQYYLRAFSLRPQRIESLVRIADHYWPENIPLCYLYANYACDAPYPSEDLLFVEKKLYQYTRFEILSRCAWHMGKFHQGLQATQCALQAEPDTSHLLNNLELYQEKIGKKSLQPA